MVNNSEIMKICSTSINSIKSLKDKEMAELVGGITYEEMKTLKNMLLVTESKANDFIRIINGIDVLSYFFMNFNKLQEFSEEKGMTRRAVMVDIESHIKDLVENLYAIGPVIIQSGDDYVLYSREQLDELSEDKMNALNKQGFNQFRITDDPKQLIDWYELYVYHLQKVR